MNRTDDEGATTGDEPTSFIVPVSDLLHGDSPRLDGETDDHIRLLAESAAPLPPILVHRSTMRVIDGHHRLHAARLRGARSVAVWFFEGTLEEAFVVAVRANVTHGLPLSYGDREAAARRIAIDHPHWSDRAIAGTSGLSAKTVKRLRAGLHPEGSAPLARVGRDGRVRALDPVQGRQRVLDALDANPTGSLRAIARVAGVSASTVRDVRRRIQATDPVDSPEPVLPRTRPLAPEARPQSPEERRRDIELVQGHPALYTERGEQLRKWVTAWAVSITGVEMAVASMPPHCAYILARLARSCADEYADFVAMLDSAPL